MRKLIKIIKSKLQINFVNQFLKLFTGSVTAEFILFAFTPVLTRIYSKQAFGIFFIFSSIISILRIISSLRFEIAAVLPKKDQHAINFLVIAMFFNSLINIILFFPIYFFNKSISENLFDSQISNLLYIIPLSTFFAAGFEIFSAWNNRTEKYEYISYSKITKSSVTAVSQISLKYILKQGGGLIFGLVAAQIISFFLLIKLNFNSIKKNIKFFGIKRSIVLIRKYKNIPIYNTLLSLISTAAQQIPLIFLGKYYGAEAAALFGLSMRVVGSPSGLVADAVGKVFYKKSADLVNSGKNISIFIKNSLKNMLKTAAALFSVILAISFFFGEIFGNEWNKTETITQIMLPALFLSFVHNPVSWIITVLNKQKTLTIANIFLLFSRYSAIYTAFKLNLNLNIAILFYTSVSFIYSIFIISFILNISKNSNSAY